MIYVQSSFACLVLSADCCWQVLDKSVRDRIPNTVRWFTTLAQHEHFASALGPVSMAAKPYAAAGAGTAEPASSSSSSRREGGSKKQKEGKKGKEGKQKAALPNGGGPGEHCMDSEHGSWDAEIVAVKSLSPLSDSISCVPLPHVGRLGRHAGAA